MKVIKGIIKFIVILIVTIVIAFNIYNFINLKVLKRDLTTVNGYAMLEVVSGSMEPTIKVGDLIVIDTKVKKYKKNDIVTFYDTNNSFVTHRIVDIDKENMITKGDNNNSEDGEISLDNLVGKYMFKIPFLGLLFSSIKKPVVLVFILIIGVLFCYMISTDKDGNPKD